ncbi:MAG TPA: xanthine dehydrogenase family protein subunit M [Methylomirabilota bacterium]
MLQPFELHRPSTMEEAAALLADRPDAALYAGGTELLLLMKARLVHLDDLIDLKRIPQLNGLAETAGGLDIGATVTHRALERSEVVRARWPLVAGVAAHVANVRVRNVGTVGGNLAFADPHSDLATLFLLFDATVRLASVAGAREPALADFVRGPYETARHPDEVLAGVRLRPWPPRTAAVYVKFGLYERPTLGLGLALTLDETGRVTAARLAVGCVSARPHRIDAAEEALVGHAIGALAALADDFGALAGDAVDPVSDLHGRADYKRDLTRVFARRALTAAAARAEGRALDARYPHAVVV